MLKYLVEDHDSESKGFVRHGLAVHERVDCWREKYRGRQLNEVEEVLPADSEDGLSCSPPLQLNLLAKALRMEGRYDEARELYERSLAVREECLGKWHPNVATSLNNLGSMLTSIGVYADAEPLLQRALEIDRKVYGMEHPRVATDFNNLAVLYNGAPGARRHLHMLFMFGVCALPYNFRANAGCKCR